MDHAPLPRRAYRGLLEEAIMKREILMFLSVGIALPLLAGEGPRLRTYTLPEIPAQTQARGEVLLEVAVDSGGKVAESRILRDTPPFTGRVHEAVGEWTFEPGAAHALVATLFRPPTIVDGLGGPGEPPKDVALPTDSIPYPLAVSMPGYPPLAREEGMVLLEILVGSGGEIEETTVICSTPGFTESARDAVRKWRFRPASEKGIPTSSRSYVIFAFPRPVGSS
jgi:TonB family protein